MSFIDLTNAPTPPRWFEFLLEPGKLQQHLESDKCDPSPHELIALFLKNMDVHENPDFCGSPLPQDSFEAKYQKKKTEALQLLSLKVASFLNWDLDVICNDKLQIAVQYNLMQALVEFCGHDSCPDEVKKFAKIINCHWFVRTGFAYKLAVMQPQTTNTTMIYLSNVQQQQQGRDEMDRYRVGQLLRDLSWDINVPGALMECAAELRSFIDDLVAVKESNSAKRLKTAHPFEKAEFLRPTVDCFDPFKDSDWKQSTRIDPYEFLESACYDLGIHYFQRESYEDAKDVFEIIRGSSDKYPLLKEYLQSANDIISKSETPTEATSSTQLDAKREKTEKYVFDCMTQLAQSKIHEEDVKTDTNGCEMVKTKKKDSDLRFEQQAAPSKQQPPDNSPWYLQTPADQQQQQLIELGKGDLCMSRGDFEQAMGCFVGALMLMSDYFRKFSKNYVDEEPYITRMIQCSISLSCYTQAVALCQMTKSLNYTIAFKQLNERFCNDCCDDIYECIWNVTILEYIINLHARRGEVERRTKAIQLIGQLELNENNPEEILREAEHVRRGRFFRIMSNKYL